MALFDRLFGKKQTVPSEAPRTPGANALLASAKEVSWSRQDEVVKLREAIKKTWGVDCQVLDLGEQQVKALGDQAPLDRSFREIDDDYAISVSSNAIMIRAHGAFIDLGYAAFLYHDKLYYVNVEPTVKLVTSFYQRTDELSHMAKIMIVLNKHLGPQRKTVLVRLGGDLTQ